MEKIWTVYILECGDGTLYTGITDDLERRLKAHAGGKGAKYTRGRGPLTLRYREELRDKGAALKRECAIKRLRKSEKMALIEQKETENKYLLAIYSNQPYTNHEQCGSCPPGEE